MKWPQQIGGVTVTFTVGHVNEMPRCICPDAITRTDSNCPVHGPEGASIKPTPHDWFASIPSFAADWPKGVIAPFHSSEIDRD